MATDAELMHQELEPLAVGETADQEFVGTFDTDYSANAFKFTLSSRPGRTPDLVLTKADGDISVSSTLSGSTYTTTITVHYVRADTLTLNEADYAFDLWDTTNDARLAAGVQPVVTPARLES